MYILSFETGVYLTGHQELGIDHLFSFPQCGKGMGVGKRNGWSNEMMHSYVICSLLMPLSCILMAVTQYYQLFINNVCFYERFRTNLTTIENGLILYIWIFSEILSSDLKDFYYINKHLLLPLLVKIYEILPWLA